VGSGEVYARAGRREKAEKLEAGLSPTQFNNAMIFAGLGDKDRTLEALDRATVAGPFRIGRALTFPEFALIRGGSSQEGRFAGVGACTLPVQLSCRGQHRRSERFTFTRNSARSHLL
jgi:hypothetical protein